MSTPWTPNKPKSRGWCMAARIDDDILIADGFCLVRITAPNNPTDTKTLAKVIGDGPAVTVLHTGAWDKRLPDRAPEDTQQILRRVWVDSEAPTAPVRRVLQPTPWCRWESDRDGDVLVRLFHGAEVVAMDHAMLDLFLSAKAPIGSLTFVQHNDAPLGSVQVWHGSTPRGLIMPRARNPRLLAGLADLLASKS